MSDCAKFQLSSCNLVILIRLVMLVSVPFSSLAGVEVVRLREGFHFKNFTKGRKSPKGG